MSALGSNSSKIVERHKEERKIQFEFPVNAIACRASPFVLLLSGGLAYGQCAYVTLKMSNGYFWLQIK